MRFSITIRSSWRPRQPPRCSRRTHSMLAVHRDLLNLNFVKRKLFFCLFSTFFGAPPVIHRNSVCSGAVGAARSTSRSALGAPRQLRELPGSGPREGTRPTGPIRIPCKSKSQHKFSNLSTKSKNIPENNKLNIDFGSLWRTNAPLWPE